MFEKTRILGKFKKTKCKKQIPNTKDIKAIDKILPWLFLFDQPPTIENLFF